MALPWSRLRAFLAVPAGPTVDMADLLSEEVIDTVEVPPPAAAVSRAPVVRYTPGRACVGTAGRHRAGERVPS